MHADFGYIRYGLPYVIIFRYLTKEVLHTFIAVTAVLLLIFLSNLFVRYIGFAMQGDLPVGLVFTIVAIQVPYLLSALLPLAFFIALLLAYGRLYLDSEMIVLFACGMSRARLIRITLSIAFVLSLITAIMMLWMTPHLLSYRNNLLKQARADVEMQLLFPGSFQILNNGAQVVYVESLTSKRDRARNVFAAVRSQNNVAQNLDVLSQNQAEWNIISAEKGYRRVDPEQRAQYIELQDGYRYLGIPGNVDYSIAKFATFGFLVNRKAVTPSRRTDSMTTTALLNNYSNFRYAAELQWRFAIPMSIIILAFLGVALSHADPRKGKYAHLLPATLVAVIYANLLFSARNTIRSGNLSPSWGMWWIHISFLMLALLLLYRHRCKAFWGWLCHIWRHNVIKRGGV